MRIPTPSDVLVVGVSPVSLAFAVLLAKGGLNVLVIDGAESQSVENGRALSLSLYSTEILKQHGFKLNTETTEKHFTEQSLSLLAHSLCCVVWGTQLLESSNKEYQLLHNGTTQLHNSSFAFKLGDLEVAKENDEANFRNIFVLAWRVIGIHLKKLHPFILNSFAVEKKLISEFYQDKNETGFLKKWIGKLAPARPENLNLGDSPVNLHLSQQRILQAGELLPDIPFYDEKLKQQVSLHQWCNYQNFSMMIIGSINQQFLFSIAKWVQFNFNIKLYYLPFSEKNEAIFKTLNMSPAEKKTLIIRPDKYIALVNDTVDTDIIDNYLRTVLLMLPNAEKTKL